MWALFSLECSILTHTYGAEIHAFVMMPNHFHLLLTVPEHDLGFTMNRFMSSVSQTANHLCGQSGHVFGGPYFGSLIDSTRYYSHVLKYVYRNPVKAGICAQVEDFPFSTLHGLVGAGPLPFPIYRPRTAVELQLPSIEPAEQLPWLNIPLPAEADALIRNGLRRKVFGTLIDQNTRKPNKILAGLL